MSTKLSPDASDTSTDAPQTSFAETALKLGGKSDDEARRTGAIDKADDQVEPLFAPQYQTVNSPVHRAVWDRGVPVELFAAGTTQTPADVRRVMDDSLRSWCAAREAGTLLNDDQKIARRRARRTWRGRLLGPAGRPRSTAAAARRFAASPRS